MPTFFSRVDLDDVASSYPEHPEVSKCEGKCGGEEGIGFDVCLLRTEKISFESSFLPLNWGLRVKHILS